MQAPPPASTPPSTSTSSSATAPSTRTWSRNGPDYPTTTFVFGTSADIGAKKSSYMPESEQTGYLNGIIAGMVTKANIVGCVGPVDGGDAARYDRGFVLGAKSVNPNIQVKVATRAASATSSKAAELAKTQINAGADFLTGSSQQAMGALKVVADTKDKTIWWAGQDISQLSVPEAPKVLAASSYTTPLWWKSSSPSGEAGVRGVRTSPSISPTRASSSNTTTMSGRS